MKPQLFSIPLEAGGRVSTMRAPPGGADLDDALRTLADRGVDLVVSALSLREVRSLDLEDEQRVAEAHGMGFVATPIADFGNPDSAEAPPALAAARDVLDRGGHVVIHCHYGIGRSSLLAAVLLVERGFGPDDVWARISEARGVQVPDNVSQRDWVAAYHAALRSPRRASRERDPR